MGTMAEVDSRFRLITAFGSLFVSMIREATWLPAQSDQSMDQ